jgi:hypothetical protein
MTRHLTGKVGTRKLVVAPPISDVERGIVIARVTLERGDEVDLYMAEQVHSRHLVLSPIESTLPDECREQIYLARERLYRQQNTHSKRMRPLAHHVSLGPRQAVVTVEQAIRAPLQCHEVREGKMLTIVLPHLATDRKGKHILEVGKVVHIEL